MYWTNVRISMADELPSKADTLDWLIPRICAMSSWDRSRRLRSVRRRSMRVRIGESGSSGLTEYVQHWCLALRASD